MDSVLYERLYKQLWKDEFTLSPHYVSSYQQFKNLPMNGNIQLYDFNISLSEMSIDEQNHLILDWISQMNDQQVFKSLVPIFFDIIKRGEDSKSFVSIINKQIQFKKLDLFKNGFNMKALFQILYNNSDFELQVMLLKFYCKFNPIPLLYKNLDLDNIKHEDEVYKLNEKLFYIIPDCLTIINFSLTSKQKSFGKTMLINTIFYQMNKFEICDKCEINNSTIDIMFDYSFSGSRQFAIADTHGIIPESILLKILPFFQIWIIQLNSENELLETYKNLKTLVSSLNNLQKSTKFCLVIRNSIEPIDKLKSNQQYDEIFKFTQQHIHCIKDLTQQNISQNFKDNEEEQFKKFIFEVISQTTLSDRLNNQKVFLDIFKKFKNQDLELQKYIEKDEIIILNLEKEIKELKDRPNGFYNKDSFPIRSLEYEILKLNEEKFSLFQQNQNYNSQNRITQIQNQITQLENSMKDQQYTKILNLFCEMFNTNNSYILYLSFVEKLRIFSETNSNQIQDKIQYLNEKLQTLKKERKTLSQKNEQSEQYEKEINELNAEIKKKNEELKNEQKKIQERSIGIELFWREVIALNTKSINLKKKLNTVDIVYELIKKGEPFEFLDGDQLKIDQKFLQQLTDKFSKSGQESDKQSNSGEEKVLVLSILGPQSSGKSLILNKIFGCHFWTSVGRCTKGIYLQLLKIQQKNQFDNQFDYILILDTEGLQNPNQKDPEFDKKIALFVLSISDIIIINVKGDINQQFKNLVEMCIFTLGQMKSVISANKQLSWCFNQNNDVNKVAPFLDQIQGIASNLHLEFSQNEQESESQNIDYNEILDIKKENIQILGFASTERSWKSSTEGLSQNWKQLIINETFSQEAYQYGVGIIKNFLAKKKQGNDENPISSLHFFIQNIETNWQSICRLPDLLEFTELIQYKQDELMKNFFFQNYKSHNFDFIDNLPNEIKKYLDSLNQKVLSTFEKFENQKVNEVTNVFDQIQTSMNDQLNKFKQDNQISKKIFQKYKNRLEEKIQCQIEDCKVTIYSEVKNYETEFQKTNGFKEIENFISDISENQQEIYELQQNENLIEGRFKNKWEQIIKAQSQQMLNIFYEYSKKQYIAITCSFNQYRLQTEREQEIQDYFIKNVNKYSPFTNLKLDQSKIFEIYQEELKVQQFLPLDATKTITVYEDIFSQPIIEKLKKAKETDLININDYYNVQVEYYVIKRKELEIYLTNKILVDFKSLQAAYQQQREQTYNYNQISHNQFFQFLLIIHQFKLEYDQTQYNNLIKAINDIPKIFNETCKSFDEKVLKSFVNLQKTFKISTEKIVLDNQEYFQSFNSYYSKLAFECESKVLNNADDCEEFLEKNTDDKLIIFHSKKIIPKDQLNLSLDYITDQNCKQSKNAFSNNFIEFFSKEMMQKKGWKKLYSQLYDIVLKEMKSNYSNINKDQQLDSDEELVISNVNRVQLVMNEIKPQIQQFNKQFALFGITLNDIGERCIYYYSMLLIWRFSCYQKQKTLEVSSKNLQNQNQSEFEKFKAAILQNKVQQSKIKAKSLSDAIYKTYIDKFYYEKKQNVQQALKEKKNINCYQIINENDKNLLENYKENLDGEKKNEILNYITDQKKFIENQAKDYIKQIQDQLIKDYQEQLRNGLNNYLLMLQSNVEKIQHIVFDQKIDGNKVNEYFEICDNDSRNDLEFEQMMFKLIKPCIFGGEEQNPILNKIKFQYQEIFNYKKYDNVFPKLNLTNLQSEQEIQQLKPYIKQLLLHFKENLAKCKKEILKLDQFDIQRELDEIKLNMIGCIESCPFCNRKCDEPNDKDHKHKCRNGHQLRGMNYVLIKDKPSLLLCEEIKDDLNDKNIGLNYLSNMESYEKIEQKMGF
ncbi:unnamed protein product [Paramecium sonneborni]|uniref:VLIG-type G domain-containing protein n=1 Tax=Paramecium sonneborni TaxID=65129 RepID=A0A8S1Q6Q5_9CILI|nr:unnamed protein product [Paramecium sonneborni]